MIHARFNQINIMLVDKRIQKIAKICHKNYFYNNRYQAAQDRVGSSFMIYVNF